MKHYFSLGSLQLLLECIVWFGLKGWPLPKCSQLLQAHLALVVEITRETITDSMNPILHALRNGLILETNIMLVHRLLMSCFVESVFSDLRICAGEGVRGAKIHKVCLCGNYEWCITLKKNFVWNALFLKLKYDTLLLLSEKPVAGQQLFTSALIPYNSQLRQYSIYSVLARNAFEIYSPLFGEWLLMAHNVHLKCTVRVLQKTFPREHWSSSNLASSQWKMGLHQELAKAVALITGTDQIPIGSDMQTYSLTLGINPLAYFQSIQCNLFISSFGTFWDFVSSLWIFHL